MNDAWTPNGVYFSATSKVTVVEFWPSVRGEVTNVGLFDCEL